MRLYKTLLHLYPKSFRHEYGGEMCRIFARRHRDASGPAARLGLWLAVIGETLANASRVHFDVLRQDLRQTTRSLSRSPGFTLTAVLMTALGVGATTAAFSLADHVLLRPLPFPDGERLVKIWQADIDRPVSLIGLGGTNDVSPANYRDWKSMSTSFSAMGVYRQVASNLVGSGEPERLDGAAVSTDAMLAVGVQPARGRSFTAADDEAGAPGTVLISDGFWRRRFGADPSAIGKTITLDDEVCTIIGIMPRGFDFPSRTTSFWRPIRLGPDAYEDRGDTYMRVIARLRGRVTREEAAADLKTASLRMAEMYPKDNKEVGAALIYLRDELNTQTRTLLIALAAAAACVLLIASTNLASLLIARATSRAREIAVRTALGAGRERLIRQLLTESIVIAVIGGALGILIASNSLPVAARLVPTALPIAELPQLDLRMLMLAAIVTLTTGVTFGVLPALSATRHAASGGLRDGARAGTSRATERLRGGLVIAQVVASVTLLVCAGLLMRALWRVQSVPPGFNTDGVLTMRMNLPLPKYGPQSTRVAFYQKVIGEVKALPGVASAGFISSLPLVMRGGVWGIFLPGQAREEGREAQVAMSRFITPEYFDVMGIPLKAGRRFDARDSINAEQSAIVSESFGEKLWPGQSGVPLVGRHFVVMNTERTIVGVVGEIKFRGLERRAEPQMYLPYEQQPSNANVGYIPRDFAIKLRSGNMDPDGALVQSIRQIVAKADPQQPVSDVRPLSAILDTDTAGRSTQVRVLGAFAFVACLLAAIGLHGLMSFVVAARTREYGVRLALGAEPRQVFQMVAVRGIKLAALGLAAGLLTAWLAARSMQSILFGLDPADIPAMGAAAAISLAMAVAGSMLPALRAARTNPTEAIRAD